MGFHCDGCGRGQRFDNPPDFSPYDLQVIRRPNGDRHWLCACCRGRAFGGVAVSEQVARDREAYAGGPRVVQPSS